MSVGRRPKTTDPSEGEPSDTLVTGRDDRTIADGSTESGLRFDLEPGAVIAERYRIERTLGRGAMGVVFEATQLSMSRSIALKVLNQEGALDPTVLRRFEREVASVSRLQHPHIIGVHDFGVDPVRRIPFLIMDLIRGRTLRQIIDDEAPLALERALRLVEQIARALSAAHRATVVHRDLKPDNAMVEVLSDGDEHLTVLDFGIAKPVRFLGQEAESLTRSGAIIGTPRYMSPEQILGDPVGPATDLYALGCILHELITAAAPVSGGNTVDLLRAHLDARRPALPKIARGRLIPDEVRRLHDVLLEVSVEARPASASHVTDYLRRFLGAESISSPEQILFEKETVFASFSAPRAGSVSVERPKPSERAAAGTSARGRSLGEGKPRDRHATSELFRHATRGLLAAAAFALVVLGVRLLFGPQGCLRPPETRVEPLSSSAKGSLSRAVHPDLNLPKNSG